MLTKEHSGAIAQHAADAADAYELALLNEVAEALMGLETLSPLEINAASLRLRRKTLTTYQQHKQTVSQSASQALTAGFTVNAMTEVV